MKYISREWSAIISKDCSSQKGFVVTGTSRGFSFSNQQWGGEGSAEVPVASNLGLLYGFLPIRTYLHICTLPYIRKCGPTEPYGF
jgi:hypothetical protein